MPTYFDTHIPIIFLNPLQGLWGVQILLMSTKSSNITGMTVHEFSEQVKLSHQRVYKLIDKGVINIKIKMIQTVDITEEELNRFKSLNRSVGRPRKTN